MISLQTFSILDVTDIFAKSEDPEELKHAWLEWHKAAGAASKGNFTEYVLMENEAAKLNGTIKSKISNSFY